jgi:nicotinamidase-related amidase
MPESIPHPRHPDQLVAARSRLLIVDLQEKLLPVLPHSQSILAANQALVSAASLFSVPITLTEQYPRGLGHTVSELSLPAVCPTLEKLEFSATAVLNWPECEPVDQTRQQVVLAGIEAHICVLQTALDLLARGGYRVYVAADAVGSFAPADAKQALERIWAAGGYVATVESILFEWCETAAAPQFKALSQIVKTYRQARSKS